MKGYEINLSFNFKCLHENYEEALEMLMENIDFNDIPWKATLLREMTEEEFEKEEQIILNNTKLM